MGADEFKLDLHLHTTRFSPCSEMTPEEALSAAKAGGLDGVVMTEHGKNWPEADLAELSREFELVVLGGVEITTTAGDILVYGSCPEFDSIPTPEELADACPDAFLVAAHPFRGFLLFGFGELDLDEAADRSPLHVVHGIEVTNLKVTPQENTLAARVAERRGLVKIGGSDAHTVSEVGRAWSAFQDRVTTCAELVEALRQGHVKPSQR
jgi:predicted metal-dependent phosphoesterase TrpH